MNSDEKKYKEGYEIGKLWCTMGGIPSTIEDTYKASCPKDWGEAKENGFYDALADYRKSLDNGPSWALAGL